MAKQTVNIGVTANDNTGDPLRTAFDKLNDNFDEVYAAGPVGTNIQISDNTIASTNTNGNIDLDPAGTGKVLVNGPLDANGVVTLNSTATVTGNIVPTSANTYSLGSASSPFKEMYVSGSSLHIGNLILKEVDTMLEVFQADGVTNAILSGNSTTSGTVLNNGNTVVALTQNGPITFFANNYQDPNGTPTVINSGNITAPAFVTSGDVIATGNIGGNLITGNVVISSGELQADTITSVGNLVAGNIDTPGSIIAIGNINSTNVITGDILATNIIGTLQTADQPNVTGLGTLTDLQVAGDLSMTDPSAIIDSYAIVANGTVTATSFQSPSGNSSLSDSGVTFGTDGSTQVTAYTPHIKFLDTDGPTVGSTLTDAFGVGMNLQPGKYYEYMGHIILDNLSNGNITVGVSDSNTSIEYAKTIFFMINQGGPVVSTDQVNGMGSVITAANSTQEYHLQITGVVKASGNTKMTFEVATTAGTVVVKPGSNFRFFEYASDTIGDIS